MINKKILITGGAGFIGSHLATHLSSQGNQVFVIDNEFSGRRENIEHLIPSRNFKYFKKDIRDKELKQLLQELKPDYVFHQAAVSSVPRSVKDPETTLDNNIMGTLNLLNACRDEGVKRVLFASSSSVYGDNPTLPKIEEKTGKVLSPYALTKQAGENLMRQFYQLYGLETVSLRYFNVFGPRQDPNSQYSAVIPLFIKRMLEGKNPQIFGDGTQSRDFTFIDNVVKGNLLFAELPKEEVAGKVFNLAYGGSISVNSLLKNLNNLLGTSMKPEYLEERPGEIKDSCADITKARGLGFKPEVSFEQGLKQTIEYYKKLFN